MVAVYVTVWGVLAFTVKVTTPLAVDGPLAVETTEVPPPGVSVTVFPATGAPAAFFNVTVTVEVAAPSAFTDVGLADTVGTPVRRPRPSG